ncbi:ABC transporter substrate-binding protein [Kiloniella litopenaei]|uniref:ABC transporter substrate-binding protein n=1 Tax=Kiloniella litopenaei TaxID=1549748 RepID=UPI003BAA7346
MPFFARITIGSQQFIKLVVAIYILLASILGLSVISQAKAQEQNLAKTGDTKRVVVIETMALPVLQDATKWFRKGMAELGYVEGQNIEYVVLNAQGDPETSANLLSTELKNQKPDMVVSVATLATRASYKIMKNQKTPLVFILVSYPEKEGFVSAIGEASGTNITGKTHIVPPAAKIEVTRQALKPLTEKAPMRIGILNSTYPSALSEAAQIMEIDKTVEELNFIDLNFQYIPGKENRETLRKNALEVINENRSSFDALWLATGPMGNDSKLLKILKEQKIPVIFANNIEAVKSGVLLSMISNSEVNGVAAAEIADQIFKGKNAGDIPVTRPKSYVVSINITTATELGTVIPSSLLKLAGKNIYR